MIVNTHILFILILLANYSDEVNLNFQYYQPQQIIYPTMPMPMSMPIHHEGNSTMIRPHKRSSYTQVTTNTQQVNTPLKKYMSGSILKNNSDSIIMLGMDPLVFDLEQSFSSFIEKIGENFKLIHFIKNHKGSRFLQKFLDRISPEDIDHLLKLIGGNFKEIMMDNYGNYFMQKLSQCCSSNQRIFILENVYINI
jgi:hypothetical protein